MIADNKTYLAMLVRELNKVWPENRTVNIAFHGHSLPAGYTAAHVVKPFDAYPHQVRAALAQRFPTAVVNCVTTAIGGEGAAGGCKRFAKDALCCRPDLVLIDYGGNDRFHARETVAAAWRRMIEEAIAAETKLILLTPAPDCGGGYYAPEKRKMDETEISEMLIGLAAEYGIGLADVHGAFAQKLRSGHGIHEYLISVNHMNAKGHGLIASEIMRWFPYIHPGT